MTQPTWQMLFCVILAVGITPIISDFVIDVKLISYTNLNRHLAGGQPCGGAYNTPCKTKIKICATSMNSGQTCNYGERESGIIGDNRLDLNKTIVGTLTNPITFQVKQPYQRFKIAFMVTDNVDLVNIYTFDDSSLSVQKNVEEAKYLTRLTGGVYQKDVTLGYQIRVYCAQNFFGPTCSIQCTLPIADQDRYKCNDVGATVCQDGLTGPECKIASDSCHSAPCQNEGACSSTATGYYCTCLRGYTGFNCENGVNDCASLPCRNGGTCQDLINDYRCFCAAGYTGRTCLQNVVVNYCNSNPCYNGGRCGSNQFGFTCQCPGGYTGQRCESHVVANNCNPDPCYNGGRCLPNQYGFTCQCPSSYTGQRCQSYVVVNSCSSNPCYNGGRCLPNQSGFTCQCPSSYNGQRCQTYIVGNTCNPNPCYNGGRCLPNQYGFTCQCPSGYTGQRCQTPTMNYCDSRPCYNGGTCSQLTYGFKCQCPTGYTGNQCQTSTIIPYCNSRPCLNGGTCLTVTNGFRCQCPTGYTGNQCQTLKQGKFTCPQPNKLFPDPWDCSKFYNCGPTKAWHMDCPASLEFNKDKLQCDWPAKANCSIRKP